MNGSPGRPRRLHTRIKAVMDAVKAGVDIPDDLIPGICKDKVFLMICEACQHVNPSTSRKRVRRGTEWCPECGEAMCHTHNVCHDCEEDYA